MKFKDWLNESLKDEFKALYSLAIKTKNSRDFKKRVEKGDAITIGEPITSRDLPRGGWVTGEGILGKKMPSWKVKVRGGKISIIPKGEAKHMHGFANLETFWYSIQQEINKEKK